MRARTTIILLVITAALIGTAAYLVVNQPGTLEQQSDANFVTVLDPEAIDEISVTEGGNRLLFERTSDGTRWQISEPLKDRVGQIQLAALLSQLSTIQHVDVIATDENTKLRDYGLAPPKMRVKLNGQGELPEYLIGRETATPGGIYLKVAGKPEVYVVSQDVRDVVNQPPDSYRDRILMDLPAETVHRVEISMRHGKIELVKQQGNWRIDTPINARANNRQITNLINTIISSNILGFADEESLTLGSMGLAEPVGAISLYQVGVEEPRELLIGEAAQPGNLKNEPQQQVYTSFPQRDGIYRMDSTISNFVKLTPNDLRDRFIARFNLDVVDRVTILPDSEPQIMLQRGPREWSLTAPIQSPAHSRKVMDLLKLLQTTEVLELVEDSSARLEQYGLERPQLKLLVSSYLSENIPGGGSGAHPLVELAIGTTDATGNGYYARLENEPFIVSIPASVVAAISRQAQLWKSLEVLPGLAGDITDLQITESGRMAHYSKVDGNWQLNGTPLVQSIALDSAANTIVGLRAVRRIPAQQASGNYQLDSRFIRFKLNSSWHKLELTGLSIDGYQVVKLAASSEYFLVSQPDYRALNIPLPDIAQPTVITQDVVGSME